MTDKNRDSCGETDSAETVSDRKIFEEPKLTFIEPLLTRHGDATKITKQGFFGTFTPPPA